MNLRQELLQAARRAPKLLGASAALVGGFLARQQNPDGGFKDRAGRSDLYYTTFALAGLEALEDPEKEAIGPLVRAYLQGFHHGESLDLVHLCCLARCWGLLGGIDNDDTAEAILNRVESFRTSDGGYHPALRAKGGSAYGTFLALGAYQDLGWELPGAGQLAEALAPLETPQGGYLNERVSSHTMPPGTNATAACVAVLRQLKAPIGPGVREWLLAQGQPQGGFRASPTAPLPDLLSTATALQALAGLGTALEPLREPCVDFIDSLWTNQGGFLGHWGDSHLDCEYTFYGLLALGCLS